jgi:hypothetical protein
MYPRIRVLDGWLATMAALPAAACMPAAMLAATHARHPHVALHYKRYLRRATTTAA